MGVIYKLEKDNIRVSLKLKWEEGKVYTPVQRHTNRVVAVKEISDFKHKITADAVITPLRGVEVGVRTADCVGIALWGEEWIGVIHAGWRGLYSGIIPNCVEELLKYETALRAFVSPAARACCYRVGEEFLSIFTRNVHHRGKELYFDVQREAVNQLMEAGVSIEAVLEDCTVCNHTYPSFRRDKTQERMLTSIIRA